ncbi:ankyrin repeat domain-containing protein [bacterium]|nr:ankyrin repeat domain-containing protein [bacterium]
MNPQIIQAIQRGLEQDVVALLKEQPQLLMERDRFGQTLLHLAVDQPGLVRLLLENGASVQAADKEGQTPLHQAKNLESVKILLSHGAPLDATNALGATPLHRAVRRGPEVLRLLLEAGADPRARSKGGATPLHWAAQGGYPDALAPLLQAGADLEATDDLGHTPLQTAVHSMVGELLRLGAVPESGSRSPTPQPAPHEPAQSPKALRLGFVHSLRGKPEVHILESPPGRTLSCLLQELNYPASQVEVREYAATFSLFGSKRRFGIEEKAEEVVQILNPIWCRTSLQKYDDCIVLGRYFVFVRPGRVEAELLQTLGVKPGDIIPRFGMAEAGFGRLDQHLDPCARKSDFWQPHVNISPLKEVFGTHEPIHVMALCRPGGKKLPARAEISLRDGGDYSLSGTSRKHWTQEGLLLQRWPPKVRQVCPREPVKSGSEKGDYQATIEWGGQEARWVFQIGSFQTPKARAEWLGEPEFDNGNWSARIRLRAADGTVLPPGVAVKVSLNIHSVQVVTYLDGLIKLVNLPDQPNFPFLRLNWSPREDWSPDWDSRTWDDWQRMGMNETAILPLPRRDLVQQGPVLVSPQKFPGSQSVSGLEVALAGHQSGPLHLVAAVSEHLELRATRAIQQAAVTVLDAQGTCPTTWLGPMDSGESRKLDLSQTHGCKLMICLGVFYDEQVHEEFFPVFRPPTLELSYEGPFRFNAGQQAQASFKLVATQGMPDRVLILVQDARLSCPFEHDFKAREWTDLDLLFQEIRGQQPPLFSEAWLDATLQLKKKRGANLPPESGPPMPARPYPRFLTGPLGTDPDRRWVQWIPYKTISEDFQPQPGLASLVKVSRARAEFCWAAATEPSPTAIRAFALDRRGALISAQARVTVE